MTRTLLIVLLAACSGAPEPTTTPVPAEPDDAPSVARVVPNGTNTVSYDVRVVADAPNRLRVRAEMPATGPATTLMLPTWIPGSYLIREYARHVDELVVTNASDAPLVVHRTSKNRWSVETAGEDSLVVHYELWAHDLSVRANFVDDSLLILNPAAALITQPTLVDLPHTVSLSLAPGWTSAHSGMTSVGERQWRALTYHELVDSPIVAGTPDIQQFTVAGLPHSLATFGDDQHFDHARAAADVAKVVQVMIDFWGEPPGYSSYVFLNVLDDQYGGLEHHTSTLMLGSRYATTSPESYRKWLGLVAHEYFHTWNVKRVYPRGLGPAIDYENEAYTSSLWFAEGLTSYYDDLLLVRAGLIDETAYLAMLTDTIAHVESTPGATATSLSQASFNAWVKYYRPDAHTVNSDISYYRKGALVGFLLDARIREASHGQRTLDDVMRLVDRRFHGGDGYTPADLRDAVAEIAGQRLDSFFDDYIDGTKPLNYQPAFQYYGLGFASDAPKPGGWLGLDLDGDRIKHVRRGTPAWQAGLNPRDELIAVNGRRVQPGDLDALEAAAAPAAPAELLVSRRGQLKTVTTAFGEPPRAAWTVVAEPGTANAARRQWWLTGR